MCWLPCSKSTCQLISAGCTGNAELDSAGPLRICLAWLQPGGEVGGLLLLPFHCMLEQEAPEPAGLAEEPGGAKPNHACSLRASGTQSSRSWDTSPLDHGHHKP